MKKLLFIPLIFLMGCTFIYDSRNQNSLNIGNAEHVGSTIKDSKFKTGRYVEVRVLNKATKEQL